MNEWDPIGLLSLGFPDDEYDCLVGPLSGMLRQGLSAEALTTALDRQISDHFGVDAIGASAFATAALDWYRSLDR